MVAKKDLGKKGEETAARYLADKGYKILERNYRNKRNEVDIIAKIGDLLVFVEVKMRSSNTFGHPETFVTELQANRIVETAGEYLHHINWEGNIRFDIISIEMKGADLKLTHFEDAFY